MTVAPRRSVLGATRTSASYSRFVVSLTLPSREGDYVYHTALEYIGISTSKYFYVKESKINRVAYRHLASSPYLVVLINYLRTGLKLITPASLVISSVSAGPASLGVEPSQVRRGEVRQRRDLDRDAWRRRSVTPLLRRLESLLLLDSRAHANSRLRGNVVLEYENNAVRSRVKNLVSLGTWNKFLHYIEMSHSDGVSRHPRLVTFNIIHKRVVRRAHNSRDAPGEAVERPPQAVFVLAMAQVSPTAPAP